MQRTLYASWLFCLMLVMLAAQGPAAAPVKSVASRLKPTAVRAAERQTFIKRLPSMEKLEAKLRDKGLSTDAQILAVFVNAWHESRWDLNMGPERDSNGGTVAGVLSLNSKGMGQGMSVSQMKSLDGTLTRLFSWPSMKSWVSYSKSSSNVADLSVRFARKVMVCRSPEARRSTALAFAKALEN